MVLRESLVHWFSLHGVPVELIVLLVSILPIFELRGGIPVGFALKLVWWKSYVFAVLGNIIPIIPVLLLLEPVSAWLRKRSHSFDHFFEWLFTRTKRRTEKGILKYGLFFGLMIFVAIPLPITGAWTGVVAAFLSGMRLKLAVPSIISGVLIAGIIVSIATYGTATIIKFFY